MHGVRVRGRWQWETPTPTCVRPTINRVPVYNEPSTNLAQRLLRFVAKDGNVYYGDAILPEGVTDLSEAKQAHIIEGDIFGSHSVTSQVVEIRHLLPPLDSSHVRTVRCLGLNYALHAHETGMPEPKFPILFYKPVTSLAAHGDAIPVPPIAQQGKGLDYECELVIVIGKRCKEVSEDEALDYVFGYAVGNDVSHRDWQIKHGGSQWSLGKGFDGWAPYGPGIVSSDIIKNPQSLRIWTRLNGQTVQVSRWGDIGREKKEGALAARLCSIYVHLPTHDADEPRGRYRIARLLT